MARWRGGWPEERPGGSKKPGVEGKHRKGRVVSKVPALLMKEFGILVEEILESSRTIHLLLSIPLY